MEQVTAFGVDMLVDGVQVVNNQWIMIMFLEKIKGNKQQQWHVVGESSTYSLLTN